MLFAKTGNIGEKTDTARLPQLRSRGSGFQCVRSAICRRTGQRQQADSLFAIVDQRPTPCALVTKPEMLDRALLLTRPCEPCRNLLPRLGDSLDLDQKELTFPEF